LSASLEWVEIKGYKTKLDLLKWKQFPEKLIVIDKDKILKYLSYAIDTYGVKFWDVLYDQK